MNRIPIEEADKLMGWDDLSDIVWQNQITLILDELEEHNKI